MKASNELISMIESPECEGFSSKPYLCPAGVPTIGYGSTYYEDGKHVKLTDAPITKERAEEILRHEITAYENAVNSFVKVPMTQGQFDALVDFAYNAGTGNLQKSTLLKKLNAKDYKGASKEFDAWVYGGGKKLGGLVERRAKERAMFDKSA